MATYLIERDVSGWSDHDHDAAAIRAKMCVAWYPGMRWVMSYFDREREIMTCVYEAASEQDIRAHAKYAVLPCNAVRLVDPIDPTETPDPELDGGDAEPVPQKVGR